jgi:hypothetical protein
MLPVRDSRDGAARIGAVRSGAARAGMNVLLDECVPWPMHKLLTGHTWTTAQRRGWGGIKNGELLQLADAEFDLFITQLRQFNQASFVDWKFRKSDGLSRSNTQLEFIPLCPWATLTAAGRAKLPFCPHSIHPSALHAANSL